jgi:hypothetical protein
MPNWGTATKKPGLLSGGRACFCYLRRSLRRSLANAMDYPRVRERIMKLS